MFHNILVCVDGSSPSDHALQEAIDLAERDRARLTIAVSIPRPPCWANTPMTAAGIEPLAAALAVEARRTLCGAVARVPQEIPVTTILSSRSLRQSLRELTQDERLDLVVLGAPRRSRLGRILCERTVRWARRHCPVTVLVVVGDWDAVDPPRLVRSAPAASSAWNALNLPC